ncbi:cysteine desulfurase [Candidatus Pacearchaeota archaeon]|nr:cysteine desulfurase [Candidatus Pacearchaeota archaeon]
MNKEYYLDNAASTKVSKKVVAEIEKFYTEDYGNPGSIHKLGEKAAKAINEARIKLAKEINAKPNEIYFTSGATESNNWALFGLAKTSKEKKKIVISSIEHPSVLETTRQLERWGFEIIQIKVNSEGIVNVEEFEGILKKHSENILIVSVIHVNNIIGTIQDIGKIGELCAKYKILFHTDAVQSFGKLKIDVRKMNIDLLSASAHKIGGPKGIGLLYVKENVKIEPLIYGGGQERGIRSGTENVSGIIGFSKALEIANKINKEKVRKVRNKLIFDLEKIEGKLNGSKEERIYNNVHVSFKVDGETLVIALSQEGIYVSAGSACESKKEREDHVLKAIGLKDEDIKGSIRITLNEDFREKDVSYIVDSIKKIINKMKI